MTALQTTAPQTTAPQTTALQTTALQVEASARTRARINGNRCRRSNAFAIEFDAAYIDICCRAPNSAGANSQ